MKRRRIWSIFVFPKFLLALIRQLFESVGVRGLVWICIITTLSIWLIVYRLEGSHFKVVFLDVGQGDATFIQSPSGLQILVDTGSDATILTRLNEVMPLADRSIDYVLITHLHDDHAGGLVDVLKRYQVNQIFINGFNYDSETVDVINNFIEDNNLTTREFFTGSMIKDDYLQLESLWPDRMTFSADKTDINKTAMVMHLKYRNLDVLLPSDVEFGGEEGNKTIRTPHFEVIKVPHQGSADGLDQMFLHQVKPVVAVISVGKNSYGHPEESIIELVRNNKISLYRTDQVGSVIITKDSEFRIDFIN